MLSVRFLKKPNKAWVYSISASLVLIFGLTFLLSPYYATWQLQRQLGWVDSQQRIEANRLEQIIPRVLWHGSQPTTPPQISGHGRRYLQQVWPVLQQQAQQANFLQLQLQFYAQEQLKQGYRNFPQQFRLQLGQQQQIELGLKRDGLWSWSVYAFCTHEAQPLLDLSQCPSDKR